MRVSGLAYVRAHPPHLQLLKELAIVQVPSFVALLIA
jgi:hypothetical protein